ncbi:MAG: hypothetical protein LBR80_17760 [Deltaproteobacteria bacterium]|jgi:hypothetical protein|nr:hypothetical protein [Deltaproteobacteria bacterium]
MGSRPVPPAVAAAARSGEPVGLTLCLLFAIALVAAATACERKPPAVAWAVLLGGSGEDEFTAAAAGPDGGAALAVRSDSPDGDFGPSRGGSDAWVVRLGPDGAVRWKTRIAGSGNEGVFWLSADADGGWLALGTSTERDGDFDLPAGARFSEEWAAGLDASGTLLWVKFLDSPYDFICKPAGAGA